MSIWTRISEALSALAKGEALRRGDLVFWDGHVGIMADAEMLREVSPVHQAARIKAPVLLAFGGQDHRVPIEHGNLMRDALRKAGNDPQWVVYPSEGHGWLTFANRVDFARRVEAFLAQHLK